LFVVKELKMKFMQKSFSLIVALILIAPIMNTKAAPPIDLEHKIAGYGAVKGDLYAPSSTKIVGNQMFVLDTFGVSTYDLTTKKLLNQFKVDLGTSSMRQQWDDPKTWIEFMKSFSGGLMGMMEGLMTGKGFMGLPSTNDKIAMKSDLCFDSKGNLFILSKKGIQHYDPTTGLLIKTLPVPEPENPKPDETKRILYSSKIVNDKLYLLQSISDSEDILSATENKIMILSLDGALEKTIPLTLPSEDLIIMPGDFVYLPEQEMFGFIVIDLENMDTKLPFLFFDMEGKEITCSGKNPKIIPSVMDFQKPNKIIVSGMSMSSDMNIGGAASLFSLTFEKKDDGSIEIVQSKKSTNKNFGFTAIDISCSDTGISLITSGSMESPVWDLRVFYIHDENVADRIGSSFYTKGKIFGSIASAVDKEGNLYETSFTNSLINKYDKNGNYISSIEMDLKVISSMMGLLTIYPTITDMTIDGDYLYCTNMLPGSINRYSFKEDSWEQIFAVDFTKMLEEINLWFTIKIADDTVFLLDTATLNEGSPNLSYLNEDSELTQIKLTDSPEIDSEEPPVFIGLNMTDTEFQFLDSIHQEIWIYSRKEEKFIEKVVLPKNVNGFYSSFDLYPDGSWIVTDVITCQLLHVSKKGDLIETIGKKGSIEIGKTKEAYQEQKDQFDIPIRAKISNKQIYVSDLLNCRYHIIPLEKPVEPKPEIKWEKDSITFENFSVFSEEIFDVNFSVTPKKEFPFKLTVSEPWMQIKSDAGKSTDQKISVKILGEKLTPWKENHGKIQVTFAEYPELAKTISVSVNAVGNIVKVTIGSDKANLNGKEIAIDKASIPLIKQGRTFVGVRFMGEVVFNNLAKIDYDAVTQTVFYELGNKKIELYIGKSYALVNGTKVNLDVPPFIQKGRTFVPLRFVGENLDATVLYDAKTQTITITYPGKG